MIKPVVFVVDDDLSVRESLELLIGHSGWRCETFESAAAFLARPRETAPSCLVLDMRLPDLDGLGLQRRVSSNRVETPIIFITGFGDVPMTVSAMKAGAVEFLTKPFDVDTLLAAIRSALERSARVLEHEAELSGIRAAYASLSRREREVMALVVEGHLNKQVAAQLGVTEITVKAHRGHAMRKMHAASLADLVKFAGRLDLPHARHDMRAE